MLVNGGWDRTLNIWSTSACVRVYVVYVWYGVVCVCVSPHSQPVTCWSAAAGIAPLKIWSTSAYVCCGVSVCVYVCVYIV
jgi:hypothetical protein